MRYSKRPKDGHGCPDPQSQIPKQKSVAQRRREQNTPNGNEVDRYLVGSDCAKCGCENDQAHELCLDCQVDR